MPASRRITSDNIDGLKWRCIGPPRGGRVVAVAGDPVDPMVFYFGACAGGIWKTIDGGITGAACPMASSAAPRSARSRSRAPIANVIYAGTGETDDPPRRLLWRRRLQIDRRRPHLVAHRAARDASISAAFASIPRTPTSSMSRRSATSSGRTRSAASSASRDGGKTWEKVLYRDADTGAVDISMDPEQPAHPVRRVLADAPQFLEPLQRRTGQRPVPHDRWRRHVGGDLARAGLAGRHARQDRRRGLAGASRAASGR